eukprot:TRINITY_DN60938_c0_g1_i1.p1 TRINITY_DN60938_c0_g1~~TRINITY_DN60938_c0_g1_i1.p1  ORF type:complete len:344 (+),score=52.16 TRINITY_DN60938_c0_g1_i1:60-1034(+)
MVPLCFAAGILPLVLAATVPVVKLRNGVEMPLLAAGTWQYNESQAEASVGNALKAGFNMVDTAFDYYNQAGVGRAIRSSGLPRESIFVETKVPGCGFDGTSTSDCYAGTVRALQQDLDLLNLTYVDLVILHFPPKATFLFRSCHLFICTEIIDQWRAVEEFYGAGKARAIGVSNYCPSCFACMEGQVEVFPMVNQVSYHIGMGPDAKGFKSYAEKHGVVLQAYSALGNGNPLKPGADEEILKGKFTTSLATAHGKSTVQVALKWLVQHGVPAVTKSNNIEHLKSDIDLWSWNLTDGEMQDADKYSHFGMPSFACNFAEGADMIV